jgi:uncharacterized protein YacL (UPF0231 family)
MKNLFFIVYVLFLVPVFLLSAHHNHMGDHMHDGKMMNHENPGGVTNEEIKKKNNEIYEVVNIKDYKVVLSSKKQLVIGNNEFNILIKKDNNIIKNATIKLKVFMPEMPGMPHMEFENSSDKFFDDGYRLNINFAMGGTWQYYLRFKVPNSKEVYKTRGSFIL